MARLALVLSLCSAALLALSIGILAMTFHHSGLHHQHQVSRSRRSITWTQTKAKKSLELQDIFVSVKTSDKFHQTRLQVILDTWFQLAPNQIWFFSDSDGDAKLKAKLRSHLKNTKCSSSHSRSALCCKMAAEIMAFVESHEKWFCHFDDDNYVNVKALLDMLEQYDVNKEWYLGKPSIADRLEVSARASSSMTNSKRKKKKIKFWFATGGAGFCVSRPLALRMAPLVQNGEMVATCEKIRLPDDVTVGYMAEHLLNTPLTVIDRFHSHLEPLRLINKENLDQQISFSYGTYDTLPEQQSGGDILTKEEQLQNLVDMKQKSSFIQDPTRFRTIHCSLFPALCPDLR